MVASHRANGQMPRLIAGTRSPFGRFGGRLRDVEPLELGATVLRHCLARADEVLQSELAPEAVIAAMGCFEAGAFVPARQIAVKAGIPATTPSLTIDRACCSGLTAIGIASKEVRNGDKHSMAVVGLESLSRTPYLLPALRWGVRRGDVLLNDPLAFRSPLAAEEPIARYTGELSLELGYDRVAQDEWAVTSHERYGAALQAGFLNGQVLEWAFVLDDRDQRGREDEQYRPGTSLEILSTLRPVYGSPTVTAGNSPGLNDGAAAAVVTDAATAADVQHAGIIVDYLETAGEVRSAAVLPGQAVSRLLSRNDIKLADVHVLEINEAYAATVLCSTLAIADGDRRKAEQIRELTNQWGGAIANGHPLGASGVRIALNVIDILVRRGGGYGIAAVCGGFGQTDAMLLRVA